MARRPSSQPPQPQQANLTLDQMKRGIARIQTRIKELEDFDPQSVQKRFGPEAMVLQKSIDEALVAAFGPGTIEYNRYVSATKLDNGPLMVSFGPGQSSFQNAAEARQYLTAGKHRALLTLRSAIKWLEEEISDRAPQDEAVIPSALTSSKVFVVHGHDKGAKDAVARFLEKIELQAVILQEEPDQGLTIIEKFESYASQVGFAVVLLTPDDLAGPASASAQVSRARQNVIFELGYFAGKLGRGRACLLRKGEVEIPSDLYGVIYTDMDGSDGWKFKLARELKAAGLKFDADKLLG